MVEDKKILADLIAEIFVDKQDEILNKLKKYDLEDCMFQALNTIANSNNLNSLSDESFVSSLSSSFLTNINTKIANIQVLDEKVNIEYIIREISNQILILLIQKSANPPKKVLNHIIYGLKVACEINSWDFEELERKMSFNLLHVVAAKDHSKNSLFDTTKQQIANGFYHYDWMGSEEDLEDLAYNMKDNKVIKSTAEFKKLFKQHNCNLSVRFDSSHIDLVIVLFDELNVKKLIQAKGQKAKHFTPLKAHAVDFDKNNLIIKEPKQIKFRITKNKRNHSSLKVKVHKWIDRYEPIS